MQTAIRIKTTVLPGNRIEVCAPELPEGADIELLVSPAIDENNEQRQSVLSIVQSLNGHRGFSSAEEVDEYLQAERNSWDK
jgi:hypothetical protein